MWGFRRFGFQFICFGIAAVVAAVVSAAERVVQLIEAQDVDQEELRRALSMPQSRNMGLQCSAVF